MFLDHKLTFWQTKLTNCLTPLFASHIQSNKWKVQLSKVLYIRFEFWERGRREGIKCHGIYFDHLCTYHTLWVNEQQMLHLLILHSREDKLPVCCRALTHQEIAIFAQAALGLTPTQAAMEPAFCPELLLHRRAWCRRGANAVGRRAWSHERCWNNALCF